MNHGWRRAASLLILLFFVLPAQLGASQTEDGEGAARATTAVGSLPQLEKTGVVVPWEDFRKILEEIRKVQPGIEVEPPPIAFAYSACTVRAAASNDEKQVRVSLDFSVEVLEGKAWVEVPILGDGVALSRFEMDGKPASTYREGGYHHVALRGSGRHAFSLEYHIPVSQSHGTASASFKFPQAPVITLDLELPRGGLDFDLGNAVVQSIERTEAKTRVRAAFQYAQDATVSWFQKIADDEKETKVFGDLATLLVIGDGVMRGTAYASFSIHGKGTDMFRLEIPTDLTVLDVDAHGVKDWKLDAVGGAGAKGRNLLTVQLNYRAQNDYSFQVSFERPLEGASAKTTVPDIALLGVLRDKGFIGIAAATNVEVTPEGKIENAAPVDPAELPPVLTAAGGETLLYGFKYLKHPVAIPLAVVKHEELAVKRTIVESARLYSYLSPEGKRITQACYRVKNNRKQYLEAALPLDATLWGAYLEGRPVKAARNKDGKVLVPLKKTAAASGELAAFDVELVYFQAGNSIPFLGKRSFDGPALDVDVLEAEWHLFLPRDKRYYGFKGNLHEDTGLNKVVYVGSTSYNLQASDDLSRLRATKSKDRVVISDGENEVDLDDLRRDEGRPNQAVGDEDLGAIAGMKEVARKPSRQGRVDPAGITIDPLAVVPAPADSRENRRNQLERNVRDLKIRSGKAEPAVVGGVVGGMDQSNAYNMPQGSISQTGGGGMRGVLPVRFSIPTDGLRLSFSGRVLTDEEAPSISFHYLPLAWHRPSLPRAVVFLLAFGLSFTILLLARPRFLSLATWQKVSLVAAVLAFIALFVFYPAERSHLIFGFAIALAGYGLARYWRRESNTATDFSR